MDDLYELGMSISYNLVLDISTELGNKICRHYRMQRAVFPPALKGGHFTTGAVDNIDHDPSSTSAHGSFHGTGISLFQHPPADTNFSEVPRVVFTMPDDMATNGTLACLPETYTSIPPATLARQDPCVPRQEVPNKAVCQLTPQAMQKEYR